MPRDLFEENGIKPNDPKDLFQQNGIQGNEEVSSNVPEMDPRQSLEFMQPENRANAKRYGLDFLASIAKGGHNIINAPSNVARYVKNHGGDFLGLPIPDADKYRQDEYNYRGLLGVSGHNDLADKLVDVVGSIPFYAFSPNAKLGSAGKAINSIPKFGNYLRKSLEIGLPQAGLSAIQNPENPGTAAAIGLGSGLIAPTLEAGYNALRPSNWLRGRLTPEQLKENLRITEGTNTGLGDVIGSPRLKKLLENELPAIPLAGANDALHEIGQQTLSKGNTLLANILGHNNPENVPEQLADVLNKAFKTSEKEKSALYNGANEIADKDKFKLELPTFSKLAKKYSDAIDQTNILKYEPDSQKIYNKLLNYKNPVKVTNVKGKLVDKYGKPLIDENKISYPSLKEGNLLAGKLGQYAQQVKQSPDATQRGMTKVFGSLAKSLKNDIRSSLARHGNEELTNSFENAEENYKKNFSNFLDKDIYKFIGGNAPPETIIQKFIKTSPTADLSSFLTKVNKTVPRQLEVPQKGRIQNTAIKTEPEKLLAYGYFSRALDKDGNLNPTKLATSIDKLGKNQFKALVPDASTRRQLMDYSKLQKMNKEAQYLMFNPKTGQRVVNPTIAGMLAHLVGAGFGGYQGHKEGGELGALIGALGGAALPIAGGKIAVKKLTSPAYREALVNAMLKGRQEIPGKSALTGIFNATNQEPNMNNQGNQ